MNDTRIRTIEQVREFVAGTSSVEFSNRSKDEYYKWVKQTLIRFGYLSRNRTDKGLTLDFIEKVSGYARIQTKQLARRYLETGQLKSGASAHAGDSCANIPWEISVFWHARTSCTVIFPGQPLRRYMNVPGSFSSRPNTNDWQGPIEICAVTLTRLAPGPPTLASGANPNPRVNRVIFVLIPSIKAI